MKSSFYGHKERTSNKLISGDYPTFNGHIYMGTKFRPHNFFVPTAWWNMYVCARSDRFQLYIYIYIYKVISVVKWHPHIFAALWHLGVLTVIEDCTLFYTRLGPEEVLIHCYIWWGTLYSIEKCYVVASYSLMLRSGIVFFSVASYTIWHQKTQVKIVMVACSLRVWPLTQWVNTLTLVPFRGSGVKLHSWPIAWPRLPSFRGW
jgi:hypothetical protein